MIALQALHISIEFGILFMDRFDACERVFVDGYFVGEVAARLFYFTL